ncbi:hypothetical protein RSOL_403700, partial [Rhizoctonia solani AG-3 Rhs1AP]
MAELIVWKLAWEISPAWRCTATTEFSFWSWQQEEGDQALDLPALMIDGSNDETGTDGEDANSDTEILVADISMVSNASTLHLGNAHYRACDVALFYTHLPLNFSVMPDLPMLGFPEPSYVFPKLPFTLIEVKRNGSHQLEEEGWRKQVQKQVQDAQSQLGEQVVGLCYM